MRIFNGFHRIQDILTEGDGGAGAGKVDATNTTENVNTTGVDQIVLPQLPDNWFTALPEEHRGGMDAYKDIPTLVKTLVHAQGLVGRDKVVIPGKEATPEDWKGFYQKVGVPENQEKYNEALGLKKLDGQTPELLSSFQKFAYENNLMPSQALAVVKWITESNTQEQDRQTESTNEQLASRMVKLKGEWGNDYEAKIEQAKTAFRALNNKVPGLFEWMQKSGMGGDPMMLRVFAQIATAMKEGKVAAEATSAPSTGTKRELDEIMASPAYWDKTDPKHKATVERSKELFSTVYGG